MSAMLWCAAFAVIAIALYTIRRRNRSLRESQVARARPVGANGIVLGANPIVLDASATHAVLLIHGFNDTPNSMAPLAQALNAAGWSVRVPLLPGHGRPLREFAQSREEEWQAHVNSAYAELRATHDTVVVGGLSMGAALAVLLAKSNPEIPALVLMAPYLGMPWSMQWKVMIARTIELVVPYQLSAGSERSIHDPEARKHALGTGVVTARLLADLRDLSARAVHALSDLKMPVLYVQSREDNRITATDAERHYAMLGSATRELRWLNGCGHIITVDYCKATVAAFAQEWFARFGGAPK